MKRIRRKQYVVDHRLQVTVALQIVYVMLGMGGLYALAMIVLPGDALAEQDAAQTRSFLLKATGVYFVLTTAILATLALITSNRVAGPAYVVRRSLEAMREGNYDMRIQLRNRDSLKELAAAAAALRDHMRHRDEKLGDLSACMQEGDLDAAQEILAELGVGSTAGETAKTA